MSDCNRSGCVTSGIRPTVKVLTRNTIQSKAMGGEDGEKSSGAAEDSEMKDD